MAASSLGSFPTLRARVAPPPRETDPDTERYLLWGAVRRPAREASQQEPLVLICDDLHWADKPTLLLLKHVVTEGQAARILIIGTYRESDLARGHPLTETLADLHREQGVERIALKGLAEQDVVEIMERAAGHELDEPGGRWRRSSTGRPTATPSTPASCCATCSSPAASISKTAVAGRCGASCRELGLPQSVREVVGRRVERLGEGTRKALSLASVIGREFDVELLLAVTDNSEDDLLELLEEAVAASVLTESADAPGRFSFAHALINHTLYEDLGTTRRARFTDE